MKAIGIVRKIDHLGRVVLPIELRRSMGLSDGSGLEIYVDSECIILQKMKWSCRLCGSCDELKEVEYEKHVCRSCVTRILNHEQK